MNPIIEKLLVLQDRDVHLNRLLAEQERLPVEREDLDRQMKQAADAAETARTDARRIEVDRKHLELEAEGKMTLVRKYKNQLLEIKNNDQFHALQHEITAAETEIRKIEDQEHFQLSAFHRFVRHPWYFFGLILIWTRDMSVMTLLSSILITFYFVVGSWLEEKKLLVYHGGTYRRYMARVPGLIPLPWKFLTAKEAEALLKQNNEKAGAP